ncbi:TusE/DsrC/DsvC family sulfur relay protein [Stutzerimonas kirkiae]|uniref:Sulfurtransferase n=1 Tax=Stutzerimonas kirkiae TaxID=2211392 RepID=A0A4Q9R6N9_9GAMM|nr:TusE/DsrC/DsvC family sulfur relay protein [Stutzerimonas kirkiae]TBU96065.1 sulfurtransferase TusE [Stutzerimonas kirkiae]TBV03103.1 sulfurtransferase TusE [Stutzerimonas kirkiae]TBV09813.1 sulfurtransferase TusE [Stutzerimonas kirkiae]TBV13457.1 sulfurtransferase TusE [Stutzerimonas kirkiae]
MSALRIEDRDIPLDPDGYLVNLSDWQPEVARALAREEGIELDERHWEVLELLRRFYDEFQLAPANRPLIKYVALKLGPEKGNSLYLNALFQGPPAKRAARLAGLPRPTNCL